MNIALLGYGKMGHLIEQLAEADGHEIVLRIDENNLGQRSPRAIAPADVAIEFSTPGAAVDNLLFCFRQRVPVVCGTTGWYDRLPEVQKAAQARGGSLIYASNFSIGVNLFFALNRWLAERMDDRSAYAPQIEEVHHTEKLDAPSGTAMQLAEDLLDRLSRLEKWVPGLAGSPRELPVASRRVGQVRGIHTVRYDSPIDSLIIRHEAHSREGFARGALQAAAWIMGRHGVYTMRDMLGF